VRIGGGERRCAGSGDARHSAVPARRQVPAPRRRRFLGPFV